MKETVTRRIRVYGIVQGVGFRPTVSRHATTCNIHGSVSNKGPYVEIFAQAPEAQVDRFVTMIREQSPKRAAILKMNIEDVENPEIYKDFQIVESEKTKGEIFVSPDIAICEECKEEMYQPGNRRYLHPFINCTCCGPRLTILDALPYDRERTSMKEFPMCPDCEHEYHDPEDRRFDAQPVCCNNCGPQVYLAERSERGRDAVTYARRVIAEGGIVAVKGIGGFHLCCDATKESAVELLRTRKKRPVKPFAVMARNEEAVRRVCELSEEQEKILTGHQKPILLLDKKEGVSKLAKSVAPFNPKVGIMLPYAPVQLLLFQYDDGIQMPDFLVMTSGNISGAPICRDDWDAKEELSHLCDCILSHDRKIRIRADDSVMDFYREEPYMIRRSRGYAPLPYMLSKAWQGQVLAVGGELKNACCIGHDDRFYPAPYVGDLEDLRTVKALRETITRLTTLLEVEPELVVADLHPKYNSTMVAHEMELPMIQVQHHYAHILSCMAENDCAGPVIGISFDGTGYGTDGTIWGGEVLYADYEHFKRIGSIEPFWHVGGDIASKEGFRIAVSIIGGLVREKEKAKNIIKELELCTEPEANVILTMAQRHLNAIESTSAGRLFDAVSAILGIQKSSTFEGEASMALEFTAEAWQKEHEAKNTENTKNAKNAENVKNAPNAKNDKYTDVKEHEHIFLQTNAIVWQMIEGRRQGEDVGKLAYIFHQLLAMEICAACENVRTQKKCNQVALSGGVFQNRLLLELVEKELLNRKFQVLRHHLIPPNDGGIGLGQAVYGMAYLNKKKQTDSKNVK